MEEKQLESEVPTADLKRYFVADETEATSQLGTAHGCGELVGTRAEANDVVHHMATGDYGELGGTAMLVGVQRSTRIVGAAVLLTLLALTPNSVSMVSRTSAPPGRTAAVVSALSTIERGLTSTKYQHQAKIDPAKGVYLWDCSIMAAWILDRTAPQARKALAADKPLARDFYRTIERARTDRPSRRWQRLLEPADILPGDVFAWLKPEMFKQRQNTGHVGFVAGKPWRHPKYGSIWLMRVADATTELHGNDSRPVGGDGGFGTGTIAFAVDDSGVPMAYGWYGEAQDPKTYVPTTILFGRVFQ